MAEVESNLSRSPSPSTLLCNNFFEQQVARKIQGLEGKRRKAHPALVHCTLVADQVSMDLAHDTTLRQQKEILKDNETHNYAN